MTFNPTWTPLSTAQYTSKVNGILFWLGNHLNRNSIPLSINGQLRQYPIPCISDLEAYFASNGVMARQCNIENNVDWIDFAESFLVNKIVDFQRPSLKEWAASSEELLSPRYNKTSLSHDDILLTICDITRNKSLIIDGLHRGRILCWDWNAINYAKNKKITIWQLRGGNMVEIFPMEAINL